MKSSMKPIFIWLAAAATTMFASGCEKTEGEGGRGSISGRVIEQFRYPLTEEVVAEYYAKDERVYIIYGTEERVYDDDMRTDFEGRFRFRWLRPGTYTIYVYSECNTVPAGNPDCPTVHDNDVAVIRTVQLEKNQDFVLEDIIIVDYP
jgi:hypothetical protein